MNKNITKLKIINLLDKDKNEINIRINKTITDSEIFGKTYSVQEMKELYKSYCSTVYHPEIKYTKFYQEILFLHVYKFDKNNKENNLNKKEAVSKIHNKESERNLAL